MGVSAASLAFLALLGVSASVLSASAARMIPATVPITAQRGEKALLCVAYPPDEFGSAGAVVSVDPQTGAWDIVGRFKWPAAVFGRPALYDPAYYFDSGSQKLFLDFGADFGYLIGVQTPCWPPTSHFCFPSFPFVSAFVSALFPAFFSPLCRLVSLCFAHALSPRVCGVFFFFFFSKNSRRHAECEGLAALHALRPLLRRLHKLQA
jgi:hypothetical protein